MSGGPTPRGPTPRSDALAGLLATGLLFVFAAALLAWGLFG